MKQINNGYAEYYYLSEDGTIYNTSNDTIIRLDKNHLYTLRTTENKRKKVSLKQIYKVVYNKQFSVDNI